MLKLCPLVKLDVFGMQTFLRGLIYVRWAIQAHLSL
jgi:hypothetical protein